MSAASALAFESTSKTEALNPLSEEFAQAMRDEIVVATREVFAYYGWTLTPAPEAMPACVPTQSVMARIEFTGKNIRGALVLLTERDWVKAWCAKIEPGHDPLDALREWANILLGRVKFARLRAGASTTISLPQCVSSCELFDAPSDGVSSWLTFLGEGGALHVRQDVWLSADFDRVDGSSIAAAPFGELVLF